MAGVDHDLIIIGAGMVGSALACSLAGENLDVALIDQGAPPDSALPVPSDLRVSAISPRSEALLSEVGIWSLIDPKRLSGYQRMVVWDSESRGHIEFDSTELGARRLGTIVENGVIQHASQRRLEGIRPGVRCVFGATPQTLEREDEHILLVLESGERLRSRLVIGADGAQSWVRRTLGIGRRTRCFDQIAIVAEVATESRHGNTAWQRFLPTGPLAFLPLYNGHSSIVWSMRRESGEALLAESDEVFSARLGGALGYQLGAVSVVSERRSFPLVSALADHTVDNRVALVGDAAHVVHPLAGQGANLGFADVEALRDVITDATTQGRDIGSWQVLRRYERAQSGPNAAMFHALNSIEALFGNDSKLLSVVRGTGLRLVDAAGPIKSAFASRAMGLTGKLPEVAYSVVD